MLLAFSSITANIVLLMNALSVLIQAVHDVCTMTQTMTGTALEEQQIEAKAAIAKLQAKQTPPKSTNTKRSTRRKAKAT